MCLEVWLKPLITKTTEMKRLENMKEANHDKHYVVDQSEAYS